MSSILPDLQLIEHHAEWWRQGPFCISGFIRNGGKRACSHVQLCVHLFDGAGIQVGSIRDSTSNLKPGEIWGFRIPFDTGGGKVRSYIIAELSAG